MKTIPTSESRKYICRPICYKFTVIVVNTFLSWKPPTALALTQRQGLPLLPLPNTLVLFIQTGIEPPISTAGRRISCLSHTSTKSWVPSYSRQIWIYEGESVLWRIVFFPSYLLMVTTSLAFLLPAHYHDACIYSGSFSNDGSLEIFWCVRGHKLVICKLR